MNEELIRILNKCLDVVSPMSKDYTDMKKLSEDIQNQIKILKNKI